MLITKEHSCWDGRPAQRPKILGGMAALPSGKFLRVRKVLRVTLEIALFPDRLENFRMVRKVFGLSEYFPDGPKSFRIAWKVSG